jgi:hypothetical protein
LLKAGRLPPQELADWGHEHLEALSNALRDVRDKKKHGVLAAVGAVEPNKRGRKARSLVDAQRMEMLAWDCYYERIRTGARWGEIYQSVANKHAQGGHFVSASVVEKAWTQRDKVAPEIPELNP